MKKAESDEGRLLSRIAHGDAQALRCLYERYGEGIFRFAQVQLRNRADAEDVVQETMCSVWSSAASFRGQSSPRTWIWGIARHKIWDRIRQERRSRAAQPSRLRQQRQTGVAELHSQMEWALQQLPPEQREVLVLAFYYNYSCREIAQMVGCKEGTVKSRIFYAKRKLAELLGRQGDI
jgi:RNA polymerase sigma-70 factor (ECF subfamily)